MRQWLGKWNVYISTRLFKPWPFDPQTLEVIFTPFQGSRELTIPKRSRLESPGKLLFPHHQGFQQSYLVRRCEWTEPLTLPPFHLRMLETRSWCGWMVFGGIFPTFFLPTWRIIPVTKYSLVNNLHFISHGKPNLGRGIIPVNQPFSPFRRGITPVYKPWKSQFGRGITPVRGTYDHHWTMVIITSCLVWWFPSCQVSQLLWLRRSQWRVRWRSSSTRGVGQGISRSSVSCHSHRIHGTGYTYLPGWWQLKYFVIFTPTWKRFPFRLIFFHMGWNRQLATTFGWFLMVKCGKCRYILCYGIVWPLTSAVWWIW